MKNINYRLLIINIRKKNNFHFKIIMAFYLIAKKLTCNLLSNMTTKHAKVNISPNISTIKPNLNHHFTKFYNFDNRHFHKYIYSNSFNIPMVLSSLNTNDLFQDLSMCLIAIITSLSYQEILSFIAKRNILKRVLLLIFSIFI